MSRSVKQGCVWGMWCVACEGVWCVRVWYEGVVCEDVWYVKVWCVKVCGM